MRCKNHRESRCRPCASHYRRRVTRVAADGLWNRRHEGGHQGMLTLTPPGDPGHDRWVIGYRRGEPRPPCSCHEHRADGDGMWNASAAARWNVLRTALTRLHPDAEFFRAVELQARGLIHLHVLLWTGTPIDLARLQALALAAGFGCIVDWQPSAPGSTRLARYAAKYVTKSCDLRADVAWETVDPATGEITTHDRTPVRTWSSSHGWGIKMREVEAAVLAAARARAVLLADVPEGHPARDGAWVLPTTGPDPG